MIMVNLTLTITLTKTLELNLNRLSYWDCCRNMVRKKNLPPAQLMTSCVIHSDPLAISYCFNAAITRSLLLASFHQILNWLPSSSISALSTPLGMCPSAILITLPYHLRQPAVIFWETCNISEQLSETRIPRNKLFTTHEKHRDDNIVASFADTRPLVFC